AAASPSGGAAAAGRQQRRREADEQAPTPRPDAADGVDSEAHHRSISRWCRSSVRIATAPFGGIAASRSLGSLLAARWLRLGARVAVVAVAVASEQVADGVGRQGGLGQEPDGRAGRDQLRVVLLGMGRDQDHRGRDLAGLVVEAPGQLQAALATQVDIQQGDVRAQLHRAPERLGAVGGDADDGDALAFQEAAGGVQEPGAVVDDQAAKHHGLSIAGGGVNAHTGYLHSRASVSRVPGSDLTSVPRYRVTVLLRPSSPGRPASTTEVVMSQASVPIHSPAPAPEGPIACTLHPNEYPGRLEHFRQGVFAHLVGMERLEPTRLRLLLAGDADPEAVWELLVREQ